MATTGRTATSTSFNVRGADSVLGLAFFGIQELEELLGRQVDLVPKDYLHWVTRTAFSPRPGRFMRRDDLYLFEIVEAADHVRDFLRDIEIDGWTEDELLRSGVL